MDRSHLAPAGRRGRGARRAPGARGRRGPGVPHQEGLSAACHVFRRRAGRRGKHLQHWGGPRLYGCLAPAGHPIPFVPLLITITAVLIVLEVFVQYHQYARLLRFLTLSLFAYIAVLAV